MNDWWMFHGDLGHTGEAPGSAIDSTTAPKLKRRHSIEVPGSVLSTPAVVDGYVYVGLGNSLEAAAQNGGQFLKIDLESGKIVKRFTWSIKASEGDTHGFCGMGCTPAVVGDSVYFSAFDGKVYCLDRETLDKKWVIDLRYADKHHNQPVTNDFPNGDAQGAPKCSGWSSPAVVDGRVYVGVGEGENPYLYSFVYCLDAASGDVIWIFCTCQFEYNRDNEPNELPLETIRHELPPGYKTVVAQPVAKGASVWSSPAVDLELDALYCSTGNPQPDSTLPSLGYTNGVLVLRASDGAFKKFIQIPSETSYRPSDIDVDIGGAPTLYAIDGRKVVGVGCKNGCFMTFDAETYEIIQTRQLLPFLNDGSRIRTVDPHWIDDPSDPNPKPTNAESNVVQAENFHGTYSTAALCSAQKRLFIGVGGNNYHYICAGIDSKSTPFIRALDWMTLQDAWPLDDGNPRRYAAAAERKNPLYKTKGESGISVPAVVNDVVFMATTRIALYAFNAADGTLLWADTRIGKQTGGMSGGYGYCMGPAIAGNWVVAGALVRGGTGGVLNIYSL